MSWQAEHHPLAYTPKNDDEAFDALFGPQFSPKPQQGLEALTQATTVATNTSPLPSSLPQQITDTVDEERLNALPLEVMIITADHEIKGLIHVSRTTREDRRISTLLNDQQRRFLAVTDAQVMTRNTPSSPRRYSFLQLHVDNIMMIHPSAQSLIRQTNTSNSPSSEEGSRFNALREKLNQV
jgi:hypothetical protein